MNNVKGTIELIRLGAYGDLIMLTGLLPGLRQQGYRIRVVCLYTYGVLLKDHPFIDELILLTHDQISSIDAIQNYIKSIAEPAERSIGLDFPNWSEPGLIRHALQQHATTSFCAQVNIPPSDQFSIFLSPEHLDWGSQFKDCVLIQTKTSFSPYKNWSLARWKVVADLIQSELGLEVRQIGAHDDPEISGVAKIYSPSIMHAIGAQQSCRLLIGLDSVFNHASQALKKKSIILWGSTNPATFGYPQNINLVNGIAWQPVMGNEAPLLRCQPCYREYRHIENNLACPYTVPDPQNIIEQHDRNKRQLHACMSGNTVFSVFHHVLELLGQ